MFSLYKERHLCSPVALSFHPQTTHTTHTSATMFFSLGTATLAATLFATIIQANLVPAPVLLRGQDSNRLPLGQNCTTDAECQSEKCWPNHWHDGPTVCSPSPAGVACVDGSTCISGQFPCLPRPLARPQCLPPLLSE